MNTEELAQFALLILEDNKALDIKLIDVRKLTNICDSMIICSASSSRHAMAMADKMQRAFREKGVKPYGIEGETVGEWVLLDYNDIIIHIMLPEIRDFYNLEKLWSAAETMRAQQDAD